MTDEEVVYQILHTQGLLCSVSTGTIFRRLPREWKREVLPACDKYKEVTVSIETEGRRRMHHALAKLKAKGLATNTSRGYWQLV